VDPKAAAAAAEQAKLGKSVVVKSSMDDHFGDFEKLPPYWEGKIIRALTFRGSKRGAAQRNQKGGLHLEKH
jgi:hypothetical protein